MRPKWFHPVTWISRHFGGRPAGLWWQCRKSSLEKDGETRYAISEIAKPLAGKKLTKKIYKLTTKGAPPC